MTVGLLLGLGGLYYAFRSQSPKDKESQVAKDAPDNPRPDPSLREPNPTEPIKNTLGMELVLIHNGKFEMGQKGVAEPVHEVEITKPFYMGEYHVTRGQFRQFVEKAPYVTEAEKTMSEFTWKNATISQTVFTASRRRNSSALTPLNNQTNVEDVAR